MPGKGCLLQESGGPLQAWGHVTPGGLLCALAEPCSEELHQSTPADPGLCSPLFLPPSGGGSAMPGFIWRPPPPPRCIASALSVHCQSCRRPVPGGRQVCSADLLLGNSQDFLRTGAVGRGAGGPGLSGTASALCHRSSPGTAPAALGFPGPQGPLSQLHRSAGTCPAVRWPPDSSCGSFPAAWFLPPQSLPFPNPSP